MIHTIYVPDVWKDLKLEFKEDISENINIDIDLSLLEPKGIRIPRSPMSPRNPRPSRTSKTSRNSWTYYPNIPKSIDSSLSSTNYNKRIEAVQRRSAKYNEKYNKRNKINKRTMENNSINHCVIL